MPTLLHQDALQVDHSRSLDVPRVYFDTQIFHEIGRKIPLGDWESVLTQVGAGRFSYRVSFNTMYELFHGLASGSPEHFEQNKQRLIKLLLPSGAELLPFTGEFLRRSLGMPTRPNTGKLSRDLIVMVLTRARVPADLLSASSNVIADIRRGKAIWVAELDKLVAQGYEIPPRHVWARWIAEENGIPDTLHNVQKITEMLDAAYEHQASIAKSVLNSGARYRYADKASDWLDNQQLYYLSDPSFVFVTHEQKLPKRLAGSKQKNRVVRFHDFLSFMCDQT